jgi:hypothetical protein
MDSHESVKLHKKNFDNEYKHKYGFDYTYFITSDGWEKWKSKLKKDAIMEYLSTIRKEIVWSSMKEIKKIIFEQKLLEYNDFEELEREIYSHYNYGCHLIRIPVTFWILYSTKYNIKIEEAIMKANLTSEMKMNIGKHILKKVRAKYPEWKPIKSKVPGESFDAINYPIELYPLVTSAIDEWCVANRIWK